VFRRLFRSWVFWIVLVLGGAVLVLWFASRPIARVRLSDGTTLILRKVTFGREHPYQTPPPPDSAWWQTILHNFESPRVLSTENACPVLHFEISDPYYNTGGSTLVTDVSIPLGPGTESRYVWNPRRVNGGETVHGRSHTAALVTFPTLIPAPNGFFLPDPIVNRRKETIELKFAPVSRMQSAILPNPFYRQDWPTWTPEPFPVEKVAGNFSVIMRGWRNAPGTVLEPDLEFKWRGVPSYATAGFEYSDATGQRCRFPALPRTESAWKLKMTAAMRDTRVSRAQKPVWLECPAPALGSHTILTVPPELKPWGVEFLVLVGTGSYRVITDEFGPPVVTTVAKGVELPNPPALRGLPVWRMQGTSDDLTLVVIERRDGKDPRENSTVRHMLFTDFQTDGTWRTWPARDVMDSPEADWNRFHYLKIPLNRPSDNQPVRIRCHWPEVFEVEFTVAPPPDGPGQ
jgi:hypothetical protein